MSEPTQPATEPTTTPEPLSPLQVAHNEVLAKRKLDKARIAELEAKLTERDASIQELTVNGPMKALAKEVSIHPDLFLEQLAKDYRIEMVDGQLAVLALDGKPAIQDGLAIPFEAEAIKAALLANKDKAKQAVYSAILIGTRASGAAGVRLPITPKRAPKPQFGLGMRHEPSSKRGL